MQVQDKVREAKGGPMMVVRKVNGDRVTCELLNGNEKIQKEFLISELTPWVPMKIKWEVW